MRTLKHTGSTDLHVLGLQIGAPHAADNGLKKQGSQILAP